MLLYIWNAETENLAVLCTVYIIKLSTSQYIGLTTGKIVLFLWHSLVDTSVGIVARLQAGWLSRSKIFSSHKCWYWHWGPPSLLFNENMGTRMSLHEVKQTGHEADHLLTSSAKVNCAWSYIPTPLYVFMAWCLIEGQLYCFINS